MQFKFTNKIELTGKVAERFVARILVEGTSHLQMYFPYGFYSVTQAQQWASYIHVGNREPRGLHQDPCSFTLDS